MMAAAVGRYLHQPIDAVEDWDVDKFFAYYGAMNQLLKAENPKR